MRAAQALAPSGTAAALAFTRALERVRLMDDEAFLAAYSDPPPPAARALAEAVDAFQASQGPGRAPDARVVAVMLDWLQAGLQSFPFFLGYRPDRFCRCFAVALGGRQMPASCAEAFLAGVPVNEQGLRPADETSLASGFMEGWLRYPLGLLRPFEEGEVNAVLTRHAELLARLALRQPVLAGPLSVVRSDVARCSASGLLSRSIVAGVADAHPDQLRQFARQTTATACAKASYFYGRDTWAEAMEPLMRGAVASRDPYALVALFNGACDAVRDLHDETEVFPRLFMGNRFRLPAQVMKSAILASQQMLPVFHQFLGLQLAGGLRMMSELLAPYLTDPHTFGVPGEALSRTLQEARQALTASGLLDDSAKPNPTCPLTPVTQLLIASAEKGGGDVGALLTALEAQPMEDLAGVISQLMPWLVVNMDGARMARLRAMVLQQHEFSADRWDSKGGTQAKPGVAGSPDRRSLQDPWSQGAAVSPAVTNLLLLIDAYAAGLGLDSPDPCGALAAPLTETVRQRQVATLQAEIGFWVDARRSGRSNPAGEIARFGAADAQSPGLLIARLQALRHYVRHPESAPPWSAPKKQPPGPPQL